MGLQYQDCDTKTVIATAHMNQYTFCGYDGTHATSDGGGHDSVGINHMDAEAGDAVSVITEGSGLVMSAGSFAKWDYVKPADDGSGRAVIGTETDHCGRALAAAQDDGVLVEVEPLPHRHA